MSLDRCIPDLVAQGKLTKGQGDRAAELYGRLQRHYRRSMGPPAADAVASRETVDALAREAAQSKRQKLLQVAAQKRIIGDVASYDGGSGKRPGGAAMALFDHDGRAGYANVEAQRKAIVGRAHAILEGVLFRHSRDILGRVRKPAELIDLVRAAFGEPVESDGARQLAEAWGDAAEFLRKRFNAAGGAIGKLARWGLPQSHDAMKIRAAGWPAWRDELVPRLDRDRMIDETTGRPFDDESLGLVLRDVFDTIRSDGLNKLTPGGRGGAKLANTRAEHRFLIFKSADDWLAYAERFGTADPFDVMMGHVQGMARDIAHMEVLGPNPAATVQWLQDGLHKSAAIADDPSGQGQNAARYSAFRVGQLFDTTSGAFSSPVNPRIAYAFGTTRQLLVAAKLGGAALSAGSDIAFQAVTRGFNGLPVAGALTGYLKLLNPSNRGDRRLAVRLGLIAEEAAKMGATQNRYLGETITGEVAARLAEGVLRASGLSAWTQAGRWAFGMELLGHLADQLDERGSHAFDKLGSSFQALLQRYGINAADWDKLRATPLYEHRGAKFLRPMDVEEQSLGDKLLRMVHTETSYAVPEATVRARSMLTFGPPGSIAGEMSRNLGLFKSFGVSLLLTHGQRIAQQQVPNAAIYTAVMFVSTTLLGGLIYQSKEITKGRDPKPMTDLPPEDAAKFWGAAALQGGGFGIFGDFLSTATSERASGAGTLSDALAGPVVGAANDAARFTIGNLAELAQGEKTHAGREAVKLAKGYVPGSSLWYGRLGLERLVYDQLQTQIDPEYPLAYRRMEQLAAQQGQDYWWRPGEPAPERTPQVQGGSGR